MLFAKVRQSLWKIKFLWLASVLCSLLFFTNACQQPIGQENNTVQLKSLESESDEVSIVLIQHDSCPWSYFWCTVEQGVSDAARDFNVKVITQRPDRGKYKPEEELQKQQKLFGETVKKYSNNENSKIGIGVTLISKESLKQPINDALEQNIPVIAYNSGYGPKKDDIDYHIYIGQDDKEAGYKAGKRLAKKLGLEKKRKCKDTDNSQLATAEEKIKSSNNKTIRGVCINHAPKKENTTARCDGFETAMCEYEVQYDLIRTTMNPEEIEKDLKNDYFQHLAQFDTKIFLSLGPIGAAPFYKFVENQKELAPENFAHGIFDLSEIILEKIEDKTTAFAVDQQPYLQGYLVVQWLAWIKRHNFKPYFEQEQDRVIPTGPYFIDKNNLEKVKRQVGRYR